MYQDCIGGKKEVEIMDDFTFCYLQPNHYTSYRHWYQMGYKEQTLQIRRLFWFSQFRWSFLPLGSGGH